MKEPIFVRSDLRRPPPGAVAHPRSALPAALAVSAGGSAAAVGLLAALEAWATRLPVTQVDDVVGFLVIAGGAAVALWYALTGVGACASLLLGRGLGVRTWGAPLARRLALGVGVGLIAVTPVQADAPDDMSWGAPTTVAVVAAPQESRPAAPPPGGYRVVAPGDCLWDIAAEELGGGAAHSEVALRVRSWIGANPQLAADPDLIHPGETLAVPAVTP